jgi:hypothetical protein
MGFRIYRNLQLSFSFAVMGTSQRWHMQAHQENENHASSDDLLMENMARYDAS